MLGLLGCDTAYFCLRGPAFRRNLLPPSSRLKSRLTIARCLVSENHILCKYSSTVSTEALWLFTLSTEKLWHFTMSTEEFWLFTVSIDAPWLFVVSTQTLRLFTVSTKAVRPLCVHGGTGIHRASDPQCAGSYFPRVKSPQLHPYSGFVCSGNVEESLMLSHLQHVQTLCTWWRAADTLQLTFYKLNHILCNKLNFPFPYFLWQAVILNFNSIVVLRVTSLLKFTCTEVFNVKPSFWINPAVCC